MSEHFNKNVGKFTTEKEIDKLKDNWRKTKIATQSNFFGTDIIMKQLNKHGAVGISIYYGMSDTGVMQPILYAVDEKGRPIKVADGKDGESTVGANASNPCPPFCPEP